MKANVAVNNRYLALSTFIIYTLTKFNYYEKVICTQYVSSYRYSFQLEAFMPRTRP